MESEREEVLTEFMEDYLKSYREVNIYRKLKKYSHYGVYITAVLAYSLMAVYASSEFTVTGIAFISVGTLTLLSLVLTVLFRLNLRSYSFSEYDLVYHEIAAMIETYRESSDQDISDEINDFRNYVIEEDEGVLPKIWREELENYFDYLDVHNEDRFSETFPIVFVPLVENLKDLAELNLREKYELEDTTSAVQDSQQPGFIGVVLESITSDVISKEMIIWGVFILAVSGGLILAFVQGQGWGVLLVTIVFGGLRLYDQQRE